jgi:hypothetical protein
MNKYVFPVCHRCLFPILTIPILTFASTFRYLTRLNGELEAQPFAASNIGNLSNFVMVNFEQDRMWFGSFRPLYLCSESLASSSVRDHLPQRVLYFRLIDSHAGRPHKSSHTIGQQYLSLETRSHWPEASCGKEGASLRDRRGIMSWSSHGSRVGK